MENAVGMETTLFGGPPEIGNVLKLAEGQIGFMTIFAHPLFQNVADIIPAMGFAAAEILTNKGVWFTRAEQEKRKRIISRETAYVDGGSISPRSQSPVALNRKTVPENSPLKEAATLAAASPSRNVGEPPSSHMDTALSSLGNTAPVESSTGSSLGSPLVASAEASNLSNSGTTNRSTSRRSSGALSGAHTNLKSQTPPLQTRKSSNTVPTSQLQLGGVDKPLQTTSARRGSSENEAPRRSGDEAIMPADENFHGPGMSSQDPDVPTRDEDSHERHSSASRSPPLPAFSFATSRPSEPTRTYVPSSYQQVTVNSSPSSAPSLSFTNLDRSSFPTSVAATTSTTGTATSTAVRPLSPNTEATSFLSADSDEPHAFTTSSGHTAQTEKDIEFEKRQTRAASAPMQSPMSLPSLSSRESSKNDIRTSIRQESLNGDVRNKGGTMPRRRSRLRLAFWRKRSDSEE